VSGGPESWYHEKESAWLYRRVAACEPDLNKRDMFEKLSGAAEHQANQWQANQPTLILTFKPTLRAHIVASLVKKFGPRATRHALAAMKLRGLSIYSSPSTPGHVMPTSVSEVGQRHRGSVSGGNLRATIFGINDGLVSNAALVIGVASAGLQNNMVLTTGVAGLLAGALSMGAGEYISVRSQRDMYEYQMALERDELAEYPEEEAEELALIYNARGLELQEARSLARTMLANPEQALATLSREELGLNPDDLGSPWAAAISSFLAFTVGALLPLLPFLLSATGKLAIYWTLAITVLSLTLIGLIISLFTGRQAWLGALRMVFIGGGAGLIAWFVGQLMGSIII